MDFENASAKEEMQQIVDDMISELNQLISTIQAVHFR
ncbi:hypothetical protein J2S19_004482 [Metabacillus malikii]|nr:hypothetical protein [Metabacillus malikii]